MLLGGTSGSRELELYIKDKDNDLDTELREVSLQSYIQSLLYLEYSSY